MKGSTDDRQAERETRYEAPAIELREPLTDPLIGVTSGGAMVPM